jgi:hypothetical protein
LLKRYLAAAADGHAIPAVEENTDLTDPFQEAIRAALEKRGLTAATNVGSYGLTVDLAVVHPDNPELFILGLMTDGQRAQNVPSARERELIIPDELRRRGWNIRQLSILDWLKNPEQLADEISREVHSLRGVEPPAARQTATVFEPMELFRESSSKRADRIRALAPFYEKAKVPGDTRPETLADHALLKRSMLAVVEKEAPLHQTELFRRLELAYGLAPGTAVFEKESAAALYELERENRLRRLDQFVYSAELSNILPRDRSRTDAALKNWRSVAPEERQAAVVTVVSHACKIEPAALPQQCWRLLGLRGDQEGFDTAVSQDLSALVAAKVLAIDGATVGCVRLSVPPSD